jgi:hypothetical protein
VADLMLYSPLAVFQTVLDTNSKPTSKHYGSKTFRAFVVACLHEILKRKNMAATNLLSIIVYLADGFANI